MTARHAGGPPSGRPDDSESYPCLHAQGGPSATEPAPVFNDVLRDHGRSLVNHIRSLRVDRQDIGDVLQEVLLAIFTSLKRFDPSRGNIRNWLAGITKRQVSLYRRRARRRHEVPDDDVYSFQGSAPDSEQLVNVGRQHRILEQLLEEVPAERRVVLVSYEVEDDAMKEIAESQSVPLGTARTRHRLGWRDARRAGRRWQEEQRRRGFALLPWLLAPFFVIKRAWAAARTRRVGGQALAGLTAFLLPGSAAVLFGLCRVPDLVNHVTPLQALGAPLTPSLPASSTTTGVTALMGASVLPAPPSLAPPQAARPPVLPRRGEPSAEEMALLQEARAAFRARKYGHARRLYEEHAVLFPASPYAAERDVVLRKLDEPARLRDPPTTPRR